MASLRERTEAVEQVARSVQGLDPSAQVAAMQEASRGIGAPSGQSVNVLWMIFVPGLLLLAAMLAVFVFFLIRDGNTATDPAVLVSALTFVLGAVVGLFAPSPTSSSSRGSGGT